MDTSGRIAMVRFAARKVNSMQSGLMTVREVAAMLKVSQRQVWKLTSAGRLPAPIRLGRSVRWRASDIDKFIALGCPSRERFEAERQAVGG